MGLFKHIVRYFKREQGGASPGAARLGGTPLFISGHSSGLAVATVFRCVKLLSESVANLPMQFLKRKDGIFTEVENARLSYLLNVQPDTAVNAFDFWRRVVIELLLDGNAYIVPCYGVNMELDRLALCGRGTVMHDTINDQYTVSDVNNGVYGTFAENEIIHIKGNCLSEDNKKGVSVLTYARLTLDVATTGDKETLNRFANGGNVRGILANAKTVGGFGEYADKQLKKLASQLDNLFQSGERIASVPGDVDFKQISLSSTDMQFLESRKFTVIEICRFFSVPPTFVYADTSSNYKSVEQADVDFLSHTLNPLLRNIEIELRRKLITPTLCNKYKFRFDRRELFACDLSGMMNYGAKLLQIGTTVNEVRQLNNLPPVEGGDVVLVSANLRNINELGAAAQPQDTTNNKTT